METPSIADEILEAEVQLDTEAEFCAMQLGIPHRQATDMIQARAIRNARAVAGICAEIRAEEQANPFWTPQRMTEFREWQEAIQEGCEVDLKDWLADPW